MSKRKAILKKLGQVQRIDASAALRYLVLEMATLGPSVHAELRAKLGDTEPSAGYVVDALMNAAAALEGMFIVDGMAKEDGDPRPIDAKCALRHAIAVLVLARDLAYMQGKLVGPSEATTPTH